MNVLTTLRRKRRSVPMLGAALLAWLVVLIAPCAMGDNLDEPLSEALPSAVLHTDCLNAKPSALLMAADCCCEPDTIMGVRTPELNELPILVSMPMSLSVGLRMVPNEFVINSQRPPLNETFPPVYLATQRLRI